MKNKEVAKLLQNMGTLLEIKGELVFKIRAYFKAADNILSLSEDIEQVKNEARLSDIPGIGKTLEEKITTYLETGSLPSYKKLTNEIPETILDVINIPSVGPKKAKLFFDELEVKSVEDLKKAAESGRLLSLPHIKQKTVDNILKGIGVVAESHERMNLGLATKVADSIMVQLEELSAVKKISKAGSLRRGKETVRDIDILVESKQPLKVMDVFLRLPEVKSVNAKGTTKSSIRTKDNVQVDLRVVEPESFGAALVYFTGSKEFNVKLRQIAIKKKIKVNEYGIFTVAGKKEKYIAGRTEKDCFKALGLTDCPPEIREEIGFKRIFEDMNIPPLIKMSDIKGDLHVHSTFSDGKNTIEEMVKAALKKGYSYLGISDHSPKLRVAGGVSVQDLKKKKNEIDRLNKKYKNIEILMGTEVEIDRDGNLDYNDRILSEFDVVIAAIHSGFEQSKEHLTNRLVKAISNKNVHAIAHPTGVHLGKRAAYDIDFKEICKAAVDHNVFLEINSFPVRLDLNSNNVFYARERGVKFVINTDSHHVDHLEFMKLGVKIARRGWLTKSDVLNTKNIKGLRKALVK